MQLSKYKILFAIVLIVLTLQYSHAQTQEATKTEKSIAVHNFTATNVSSLTVRQVTGTVEKTLFANKSFVLKEINPADLVIKNLQVKMQKLKECQTVDCATELGSLLAVDYIITGEIVKDDNLLVNLKVIDVKKKKVILLETLTIKEQSKLTTKTKNFIEEIIEEIKNLEKGNQLDIILSTTVAHVKPLGYLKKRTQTGVAYTFSAKIKGLFLRNIVFGSQIEYINFDGKAGETHHAILMPFSILCGYSFNYANLFITPNVAMGASYNRLYKYLTDSTTEYEEKKNTKPFFKTGLDFDLKINDILFFQINTAYSSIIETDGKLNYLTIGAGLSVLF